MNRAAEWGNDWAYSHSVVAGGLGVKSYRTRDIPWTERAASAIFSITCHEKEKIINWTIVDDHVLQ